MNYFWIKLKLLSTYPNFSPSFQLYYYFLCPCHQPFFIAYLVKLIIAFHVVGTSSHRFWALVKYVMFDMKVLGLSDQMAHYWKRVPTAYIPLSFTSLRSSSSSFVPWSLLLLSSSQWFPLESSVPAQLRFFKTSNLLFFFPLLILASSTFHFCSVSLQLLDIFFCLPPYPPSTNLSLFFATYFGWTLFNKFCQFVHQNT